MKNEKGVNNLNLITENASVLNQSIKLNKEEKEVKVLPKFREVVKKLAAYATATVLFLSPVALNKAKGETYAEEIPTKNIEALSEVDLKQYKEGDFIENYAIIDGISCNGYVVKRGDTTSRISEKASKYLHTEKTTKYWPVIAYLNDYPRIIRPKDVVAFPSSVEDMDELLTELKASNWVSKYIQYNGVYKKHKRNATVGEIIDQIYGKGASQDPTFVRKYLKTVGMDTKKFNASSELNSESYFRLTDWIPTIEELGMESSTTKKKSK